MPTKHERIAAYLDAYKPIEALLPIGNDLLDFRPFADAWTIRENILHLLDADLNGIVRLKKAIAQPGTPIVTYDEEKWTQLLAYDQYAVEPVIAVNRSLRELTATLLRAKVNDDWNALAFSHPDNGLVSLDRWIDIYIGHVDFHVKLIDRNRQAFRG